MSGNCGGGVNSKYKGQLLGSSRGYHSKTELVDLLEEHPAYIDNSPTCTLCDYPPFPEPQQEFDPHDPDYRYFTLSAGAGIGGTLVITSDRYGNYYLGLGGNAGKSLTAVSVSYVHDWVGDPFDNYYPDEDDTESFLTGLAVNISGGVLGGGGMAFSPTSNTSVLGYETGFYSPQAGVSIVGSGMLYDN